MKFFRKLKSRRLQAWCRRKHRQEHQPLCYSANGFLTDILEHNGFAVRSLECCGPNNREFRIVVDLMADEELFMPLLKP